MFKNVINVNGSKHAKHGKDKADVETAYKYSLVKDVSRLHTAFNDLFFTWKENKCSFLCYSLTPTFLWMQQAFHNIAEYRFIFINLSTA